MVTFDSTDLDNAVSESGVSHESVPNTDHDNASRLQQGYDFGNFSEISPDPIHCWPLQEDSGSTVNDIVGTADGNLPDGTPGAEGPLGTSSYAFDGVDSRAELPSLSVFSGLTVLFWVRYHEIGGSGTSNEWNCALGTWADNGSHQFTMEGPSEGNSKIHLKTPGGTALIQDMSNHLNTWVMFAGTYDGTTARTYFNASQGDSVSTSNIDLSGGMRLGGRGSSSVQLDGLMSSVFLYDQALSQSQIQSLFDVVDTAGSLTTPYKTV